MFIIKFFRKYFIFFITTSGILFFSCKNNVSLNVTNIYDSDSSTTYTVRGSVGGLSSGDSVILSLNGSETKTVSYSSGIESYSFSNRLNNGDTYSVTLTSGPLSKTCSPTVTNQKIDSGDGYVSINCVGVGVGGGGGGTAGVTVSPTTGLETTEGGGKAGFSVWLNSAPTASVTMNLSSSSVEGTVLPASLTFDGTCPGVNCWSTPKTVTVTGADDITQDGNKAYLILIAAAVSTDTNYNGIDPIDPAINNIDNETAGVIVTPSSGLTVSETGTATFTAKLSSQPVTLDTIVVSFNSALGGASGEVTYSPVSLNFNNANWNTPQTVTITGVNDSIADGNKSITLSGSVTASALLNPAYNGLALPVMTFTSVDVGTPGITVTPISTTVNEAGPTTGSFTVVLNTQPSASVTIPLTASASATGEGSISIPASGNLNFTAGTCPSVGNWCIPQTVTISGVDDAVPDGNKNFTIYVAKDGTNALGTAITGATEYTTINPPDVNFTNVDNETASVVFSISPGTVLYTNEAAGAGHTASFTVRLGSPPVSGTVTLNLGMSVAGQGTLSATALTFTTATFSTPQTVTITSVDDLVTDGNTGYQVQVASITGDAGGYNALSLASMKVDILDFDNDLAGVTLTRTLGLQVYEIGSSKDTFGVKLNSSPAATKTVQIDFTSFDTSEGTVTPSLTFTDADWNTFKYVTVTGADDALTDGNFTYTIDAAINTIVTNDAAYSVLTGIPSVSVTTIDDESYSIVLNKTTAAISETGTTDAFTVKLSVAPTSPVTINLNSNDLTEGTIDKTSLTFDNGCPGANCWSTAQIITITPVNDLAQDGNAVFSVITNAASSADPIYNLMNASDVTITNSDDDTAGVTILDPSPAGLNISEAGQTDQFQIKLNTEPLAGVTVRIPVSISAPTHQQIKLGAGAWLGAVDADFDSTNWFVPQTITVQSINDITMDRTFTGGQPTFTVTMGPVSVPVGVDANYNGMVITPSLLNGINNENEKFLFITSGAGHNGNFDAVNAALTGGPSNALNGDGVGLQEMDSYCNLPANGHPGIGTYLVFAISDEFIGDSVRRASWSANLGDSQLNWVLKPNTTYFRSDAVTSPFTTNAVALFSFPLANSISTVATQYWTGISNNWAWGLAASRWTAAAAGTKANFGVGNSTSNTAISDGLYAGGVGSNSALQLLCIEQ